MRISSSCDSPYYSNAFSQCTIYLAGAARSNVVEADEEGRYALTWRPDEWGKPVLHKGVLQLERYYGDVRIECPAWLRAECESPTGERALAAAAAVLQARMKFPGLVP